MPVPARCSCGHAVGRQGCGRVPVFRFRLRETATLSRKTAC